MEIRGRNREIALLNDIKQSSNSSFVAIYGRRRVGKTFLIRELFANEFTFYTSGVSEGKMKRQLKNFHSNLKTFGSLEKTIPKDWFEAFDYLKAIIDVNKTEKKIIFIDEMPWLDTPRSEFVSALESFWNHWASARNDIMLIACGSATSWIIKKIVNNTGGLHNRITHHIHLQPFTLLETEEYLKARGFQWTRYQIVQAHMVFGGVPYYLEALLPHLSVSQNIDDLFFSASGIFRNEFTNLFNSLFKKADKYISVINALSSKERAMSRNEISQKAILANGGGLTEILNELELCDFITKTYPLFGNKNYALYQIKDAFSLFHHRFLAINKHIKSNFWLNNLDSAEYRQWTGVSYEKVCFNHIIQICKALGISGIQTSECSWRDNNQKPKTQIDLLIDRKDQVINLCEIKFSEGNFSITKDYADNLRNKINVFKTISKTKKAVFLTMITSYPISENQYSSELLVNRLTMEDLFQ